MLIAQKLKKENIAEYMLYMWQIEDIIRANKFDIDKIKALAIDGYDQPDEKKKEITEWYESLIEMMRHENILDKGHLIINQNTLKMMDDLHKELLKSSKHGDYQTLYYNTLPFIVELRAKGDKNISELETCLSALYAYLLMKMKGNVISEETAKAISQISDFLRLFSFKFREDQNNRLEV